MKKKFLAATLALSMAIATMGTAMSVYAADATESGTLKLVLSTMMDLQLMTVCRHHG